MNLEQIAREVGIVAEQLDAAFHKTDIDDRFPGPLSIDHHPAHNVTIVQFFGHPIWCDEDDNRDYLYDEECEVIVVDGEEQRVPLNQHITQQIRDLAAGLNEFLNPTGETDEAAD